MTNANSPSETFRELLKKNPILPAPMCGISDRAEREIVRLHGAGLVYTEMLSVEGLSRADRKTFRLLDIEGEKPPVAVQLFGARPEAAAEGARIVEGHGASVIDFNMGCPARKVVGSDCGAALLKNPPLAGRIVAAVVKAVSIPLTVKMRWDWDEETDTPAALEVARICESEGAAGVCLHARTREAKFAGKAQWERIADLKQTLSAPVIGNGDVWSPADALAMFEQTGCDAVMIGRGLIGAPWLISGCLEALRDKRTAATWTPPPPRERIEWMCRHARAMARVKGEDVGLREFRKHAVAYLKGIRNSRPLKNAMMQVKTVDELDALAERSLSSETGFGEEEE